MTELEDAIDGSNAPSRGSKRASGDRPDDEPTAADQRDRRARRSALARIGRVLGEGAEMGQVSVPVNGRSFAITCDDGQERASGVLRNMSTPRSPSSSEASVRSERRGCCCSPRWSSPTSCRTPTTRFERERNRGRRRHGKWRRGEAARRVEAYCGAAGDTLASRMRSGAGRCVRPHVTPGPIPTSWGLSLSKSWLRHMVAHLLRRATEELHADGRAGSTPQLPSRQGLGTARREHPVLWRRGRAAGP